MLADLKSNNPPSQVRASIHILFVIGFSISILNIHPFYAWQALALSAIANVGGRQMADAVADVVANLLMSK